MFYIIISLIVALTVGGGTYVATQTDFPARAEHQIATLLDISFDGEANANADIDGNEKTEVNAETNIEATAGTNVKAEATQRQTQMLTQAPHLR